MKETYLFESGLQYIPYSGQKSKVICGFAGVGKTFMYELFKQQFITVSDSDSSQFSKIINDRHELVNNPNFVKEYLEHIKELIAKGFQYIFVSTHPEVLDALIDANIKFTICYPCLEMKQEMIQRYKERGSPKELIRILETNYDNWIENFDTNPKFNNVEKWCLKSGEYLQDKINIV